MHVATNPRTAHLGKTAPGGWTIQHVANSCRTTLKLAFGILVVSSALLLPANVAYAQSDGPMRLPVAAFTPEIGPTTSASTSMVEELVHTIVAGDTLLKVAQQYDVEPANLAAYNQIVDHNHVVLGQKLRIPPVGVVITAPAAVAGVPGADGYHVMRQGDALGAIARQYGLTLDELLALNDIEDANLVRMGTMLRLTDEVEPPTHALPAEVEAITHVVQAGETLAEIAQAYTTTPVQILHDNSLIDSTSIDSPLRVGLALRIFPPATAVEAFGVDAPARGERKIVINLSDQTLSAYQGDVRVLYSIVSTGKDATPTIPGEFAVYQKLKSQHMSGDDYDLPGVPWVMYYYDEFAIHGAYWHANFGIPTSHGCTNMTISESKALFSWAPLGTRVVVEP